MGLKSIIIDLFHLFNLHFGIHRKWYHETSEKLPFYLPFGKAEDTPSPSLPRVRGKVLQLHPWRLRSGASSTFATLGLCPSDRDFILCCGLVPISPRLKSACACVPPLRKVKGPNKGANNCCRHSPEPPAVYLSNNGYVL